MQKEELINDEKFREKCSKYGLNFHNFKIFNFPYQSDYIILLNEENKDIYILLDKNYNTLWIQQCDWISDSLDKDSFVRTAYLECFLNIKSHVKNSDYFFNNYSLREIINYLPRITIKETKENSFELYLDDILITDKEQINLYSYIKFLAEKIEEYFFNAYKLKMLGIYHTSVYEYIKSISDNIKEFIKECIENGYVSFPIDKLNYLNQNNNNKEEFKYILHNIIDYLMSLKEEKENINYLTRTL